jgi:hypothetical protein
VALPDDGGKISFAAASHDPSHSYEPIFAQIICESLEPCADPQSLLRIPARKNAKISLRAKCVPQPRIFLLYSQTFFAGNTRRQKINMADEGSDYGIDL